LYAIMSQQNICKVVVYKTPIKLVAPFTISLGRLDYAQNLVVCVHTKQGLLGFGECSPFLTINGESIETCYAVSNYLGKALLGCNALDIPHCTMRMDQVIYANSSIKSAFDIALYDIAAQASNQPLYAFLGAKNQKIIQTDYTVSIGEPAKMAADAAWIKQKGFPVIKVKLGGAKLEDVLRMSAIRSAVGQEIPIRIDANQGWKVEEALEILQDLAPFNIQHCEEPIPRWAFMYLPKLKQQSPIPIMADESCCDHNDAQRLVDIGACDLFNVKLSKSGGLFKALKMLKIAEENKIKVQIGGFLESRLAFTAAAHLALVSDSVQFYDFDTPLMLSEDNVLGGLHYGENGLISVPETPGLGATVDLGYLNRQEYFEVSMQ
jgi:L-Ala-D/L-Glu epimerase